MAEQEKGMASMMARQWFRTHRGFVTHVFDRHENEVLRVCSCPFRCVGETVLDTNGSSFTVRFLGSTLVSGSMTPWVLHPVPIHLPQMFGLLLQVHWHKRQKSRILGSRHLALIKCVWLGRPSSSGHRYVENTTSSLITPRLTQRQTCKRSECPWHSRAFPAHSRCS